MQRRIISIIIILLVLTGYAFLNSSYFTIYELQWEGLKILQAADLFAWTGFKPSNVFRVDQGALANQVAAHVWVKSAEVSWDWPNKLTVKVVERTPIALVPINESWSILDTEGDLLPLPRGFQFGALPLITQIDPEDQEQFIAIARLLNTMPLQIYDLVSEWNAAEQALITRAGTKIILGDLRELERKLATLELILEDLANRKVIAKKIDLRIINSPIVIE